MNTHLRAVLILLLCVLFVACDESASVDEEQDTTTTTDTTSSTEEDTSATTAEDATAEDGTATEEDGTATAEDATEDTQPPDDATTTEDATTAEDVAEDTIVPVGDCEVTTTSPEDGSASTCAIDAASMLGCEALASCLCEHMVPLTEEERERCTQGLLYPRGMITLSDYCTLSGTPFAGDIQSLTDLPPDYDTRGFEVAFSEGCSEVATFTLWGDPPTLSFSISNENATLPDGISSTLSDYDLVSPPLLDLSHISRFHHDEGQLTLTAEGQAAIPVDRSLLRRHFVFHSGERVLLAGRFASETMSTTLDGPVIVVERLVEGSFTLDDGYPAQGVITAPPGAFQYGWMVAILAATRKRLDATCITDATCLDGYTCNAGRCAP